LVHLVVVGFAFNLRQELLPSLAQRHVPGLVVPLKSKSIFRLLCFVIFAQHSSPSLFIPPISAPSIRWTLGWVFEANYQFLLPGSGSSMDLALKPFPQ
jgi:hypothetical protein